MLQCIKHLKKAYIEGGIILPWWGTTLIIIAVVALVLVGLTFLGKRMQKKMDTQQSLINEHKTITSILVIDKKKQKLSESNLPKAVVDQVPKLYKFRKMPLVKAKIGPQITTLLCDDRIFDSLPTKKMVKVELAGIYIVGIKGKKIAAPKKQSFFDKLKSKVKKNN